MTIGVPTPEHGNEFIPPARFHDPPWECIGIEEDKNRGYDLPLW